MAIDGNNLGTDITDAIENISEYKPWQSELKNKILDSWQAASGEIASHVNDEIVLPAISSPTLINNWENYGTPYRNAGFYKFLGIIYLTGMVKIGTDYDIFILPEGYRPDRRLVFQANSSLGGAKIEIFINGNVVSQNFGLSYISLDGINFRI